MTDRGKIVVAFILGVVIGIGGFFTASQVDISTITEQEEVIICKETDKWGGTSGSGKSRIWEYTYKGEEISEDEVEDIVVKAYKEEKDLKVRIINLDGKEKEYSVENSYIYEGQFIK